MMYLVKRCIFQQLTFRVVTKLTSQAKMMSTLKTPLDYIVQQNDMSFETKTKEFCKQYSELPPNKRIDVLKQLAVNYTFDKDNTKTAAESYLKLQSNGTAVHLKAADRLKSSLMPHYAFAFNRIRKIDGGVKFLVDVREDILKMLPSLNFNEDSTHYLKALNNFLKEVLAFSFNIGFLKLERVTWASSCSMLQKISEYEAVHPVRNWTDIKQRVGPYRRCFVFTHSCMPEEPLVVLHTALTSDISSSVASIVRPNKSQSIKDTDGKKLQTDAENPELVQAAIFYSITSTQKGLHGIELGNQIIKKVVHEVQAEFPHISKFSSLSPIPGFRDWLLLELKKMTNGSSVVTSYFSEKDQAVFERLGHKNLWSTLQSVIASNRWIDDGSLQEFLKTPLMKICAHYLYTEKRRAYALNSVAHFHLRNGAVMWRLNWLADTSPRGLDNSCGMMVNYRYYLKDTESNSKNYIENHYINASEDFQTLLTPAFTKSSL
ncbi:hypothetical protein JTE90_006679 [Oedothorax gibbosus]|uniref:Malonyl-CoA decarboxylase n=1 Tax=Oedothorax gibbosus TaxID=931172 RepID=A0AAV6V176_9ARAC|nr:hypothetical protein JTE90_006679 [Oedothorax gibbosus]